MQSKLPPILLALLALLVSATSPAANDHEAIQQRFAAALEAIEADRLRTARETLRALLDDNPSLLRARLELARVHWMTADYEAAREEVEQVLADPDLPPQVRVTVLAFLAQIRADEERLAERSPWSGSFYAGLMYDSNVNFGPSRDIIDIGGLPFVVAPDSRERGDFAAVLAPALTHTADTGIRFESGEHVGAFFWQTRASGYYRAYFDENDFNLGIVTLSTGPVWSVPRRWRASLALQGDQIWLDNARLAWFATLNPALTWNLGPATELTVEGVATRREYRRDVDRERRGWYQGASLSVDHSVREGQALLQAGVGYYRFSARASRFSYQAPEVFAGLAVRAWQQGTVHGRVTYRHYDFRGEEPLFARSRSENEVRLSLGFEHEFAAGAMRQWALQGNWSYTSNGSNVALFDYDRHQVNLGLSRRF